MGRTKQFERSKLLDQAIQIFWQKGFQGTSLCDLEQATGVNKSGLYSEFKDKDDIFTHALRRYSETVHEMGILSDLPLGRQNLINFLLSARKCEGQQGCFIANSMREISILPCTARNEIEAHQNRKKQAIIANLKAIPIKIPTELFQARQGDEPINHHELLADCIITYHAGLSLRLNLCPTPNLANQAHLFIASLLPEA